MDTHDPAAPSENPPPAAEGPEPTPLKTADLFEEETACWVCGGPVIEHHCKIVCQVCGFTRDCSDP